MGKAFERTTTGKRPPTRYSVGCILQSTQEAVKPAMAQTKPLAPIATSKLPLHQTDWKQPSTSRSSPVKQYEKAESLYRRALVISEMGLGPDERIQEQPGIRARNASVELISWRPRKQPRYSGTLPEEVLSQ
jgi:hypothetical protein